MLCMCSTRWGFLTQEVKVCACKSMQECKGFWEKGGRNVSFWAWKLTRTKAEPTQKNLKRQTFESTFRACYTNKVTVLKWTISHWLRNEWRCHFILHKVIKYKSDCVKKWMRYWRRSGLKLMDAQIFVFELQTVVFFNLILRRMILFKSDSFCKCFFWTCWIS